VSSEFPLHRDAPSLNLAAEQDGSSTHRQRRVCDWYRLCTRRTCDGRHTIVRPQYVRIWRSLPIRHNAPRFCGHRSTLPARAEQDGTSTSGSGDAIFQDNVRLQIRRCDGRRGRDVRDQASDVGHQTRATVGTSAALVRITRTPFSITGLLTFGLIELCPSYRRAVKIKHHNIPSSL
jgi:hypothetical protein